MRVAFLAWRDLAHPRAGGSETVVDRWAAGLQARGHQVQLVCGGPVGLRDYPVTASGGTYSQYLRAPLYAVRKLRDWDVVVDVSNGIPFFAPAWRRAPVLCVVHHVHRQQWRDYFPAPVAVLGNALEQRVVPALYRRQHFVGISRSTCEDLVDLGVRRDRVHLVENGLDDDVLATGGGQDAAAASLRPARAGGPTFLALGRVAVNKRLDLLLDMWEQVRSETGGRLLVVGDGPELPRLRARAVPGVELRGRVSEEDKRRLLREADLLVHAAPREGWGLVVMEAAAAGTPTLGFDVPGVRDTVVHDETGVLAGDPADFRAAWRALSGDPDRRQRLGAAAVRRARAYTWDRTLDAFEAAVLTAAAA